MWLRREVLCQDRLRFDWIRSEALAGNKLTDLTHQVSIALHLRLDLVYFALDALDRAVRDAHTVYFAPNHVALFHDEEALNLPPGLVAEDRHGKLQVRQLWMLPTAGPILGVRRQLVVLRVGRASVGALGVARARGCCVVVPSGGDGIYLLQHRRMLRRERLIDPRERLKQGILSWLRCLWHLNHWLLLLQQLLCDLRSSQSALIRGQCGCPGALQLRYEPLENLDVLAPLLQSY